MSRLRRWPVAGGLVVAMVTLAGCEQPGTDQPKTEQSEAAPAAQPETTRTLEPTQLALPDLENRLSGLYDAVSPAVVHIAAWKKFEHPQIAGRPDMFGFPMPDGEGQGQGDGQGQGEDEQLQVATGSGFVWDKTGYIISNNHVVGDSEKLRVTFHDGTTVPAKLVGTDPDSDLGVIKVDMPADRLTPIAMADSNGVKVGNLAVAIGNPFGLEGTMTVGFVSALGRVLPTEMDSQGPTYTIPDVIQTDAPINPGNSGGVLVNSSGQLIGVPFVIYGPSGASAGIGFAIPSALVQKVVPALIADGHYQHTWLGITGVTLSPDMAEAMKLDPSQRGALVGEVVAGSPAADAKLEGSDREISIDGMDFQIGGDVIIGIDDEPVKQFDDIVAYLARETSVGQKMTLTILRAGKERKADVTLKARPDHAATAVEAAQNPPATIGILGAPLTPEVAAAMGLEANATGVLVVSVRDGGPAAKAGLRGSTKSADVDGRRLLIGGDVIVSAEGKPVRDVAELQSVVAAHKPGDAVSLKLLRDKKETTVKVTLAPAQ